MVYFVSINFFAFILCFVDKRKAIYHGWRIPEDILLFCSFMGGCFGMMIGMYIFHHKTRKLKFKLVPILCIMWFIILSYYL